MDGKTAVWTMKGLAHFGMVCNLLGLILCKVLQFPKFVDLHGFAIFIGYTLHLQFVLVHLWIIFQSCSCLKLLLLRFPFRSWKSTFPLNLSPDEESFSFQAGSSRKYSRGSDGNIKSDFSQNIYGRKYKTARKKYNKFFGREQIG